MLENDGFEKKEFDELADVYVINTCSVTENADKECRQLVRRIQRKAPESLVVITGCYAQLKPKEIAQFPVLILCWALLKNLILRNHLRELQKVILQKFAVVILKMSDLMHPILLTTEQELF